MIEIITKFDIGQVANLKKEERMSYEASLKQKRDWESVLATVRNAGLALGRKEERARAEAEKREKERTFIRNLIKQSVFTDEEIAGIAETTVSVVEDVRKEFNKNSEDSTK